MSKSSNSNVMLCLVHLCVVWLLPEPRASCCWAVAAWATIFQHLKGKKRKIENDKWKKYRCATNGLRCMKCSAGRGGHRRCSLQGFILVVSSALIRKQGQHHRAPPFPRDRKQLIRGPSSSLIHSHPLWNTTSLTWLATWQTSGKKALENTDGGKREGRCSIRPKIRWSGQPTHCGLNNIV